MFELNAAELCLLLSGNCEFQAPDYLFYTNDLLARAYDLGNYYPVSLGVGRYGSSVALAESSAVSIAERRVICFTSRS